MGQALLNQSFRMNPEISRAREAAQALSRLHGAVRTQNALQKRIGDGIGPIIEDLLNADTPQKAMSIADYLNRDFSPHVRQTERALRAAIAADSGLMRNLGSNSETLYKRLRGLERLVEPVRRAVADLVDPACHGLPISLIRHGLELIEHLKRHQAWIEENVLPVVISRYQQLVAGMGADMGASQLDERVSFDDIADDNASIDVSSGRDETERPDENYQMLVRGLQARYGIRVLPNVNVPERLAT